MNPMYEQVQALDEEKKYIRAENDLWQAIKSFQELKTDKQEKLIKKFIGEAAFYKFLQMMKNYQ